MFDIPGLTGMTPSVYFSIGLVVWVAVMTYFLSVAMEMDDWKKGKPSYVGLSFALSFVSGMAWPAAVVGSFVIVVSAKLAKIMRRK